MRRVILLCGPPGAGKSTWAEQIGWPQVNWTTVGRDSREFQRQAWEISMDRNARVVVERGLPTLRSRFGFAAALRATDIFVMPTPLDVCHERITRRGNPDRQREHVGAWDWWKRYEPFVLHRVPPSPEIVKQYW